MSAIVHTIQNYTCLEQNLGKLEENSFIILNNDNGIKIDYN
jgi:hypothetical protein